MSLLAVWRTRAVSGVIIVGAVIAINNKVGFILSSAVSIAVRITTCSLIR